MVRNASAVAVFHGGRGWFEQAVQIDPSDQRSRTWLARQAAEHGDIQAAAALLGSPETTDGWLLAARLAWEQGDENAAIAAWRQAPNVAYRFLREGEAAVARGDVSAARQAYTLATLVRPASSWTTRQLGLFLLGPAGDPAEAAAVLARAIEQGEGDNDPYVYVEYAHALQQSGRLAEAVSTLVQHPLDTALANAIRAEGARATGDLQEAARLLERATRQDPSDPWFWLALGHVYAGQGRSDDARAAWQQAVRIAPTFQPARDALGLFPQ
ncbi:MAG: hypothetical protein KatS3mg060_0411 [Dehalococcoidia bacterium]|nr:MAG: hypothetical protein KatS3mg060_0411 [Dehalococcoidia bacterium]